MSKTLQTTFDSMDKKKAETKKPRQNKSESLGKPPLPVNHLGKKRKLGEGVLSTITSFSRVKETMGTVCAKRSSTIATETPQKKRAKKTSIASEAGILSSVKEPKDITKKPLAEVEKVEMSSSSASSKISLVMTNSETRKTLASVLDGASRSSLPNLPMATTPKINKRVTRSSSHGDAQMKCSMGSGNLLQRKTTLSRKDVAALAREETSGSQTSLNFEKRKKRSPTKETGIHVLEEDQVNYYQILEEIGRGSFGSVCRCLCHKDNSYYAMKIMSKKRLMRKNGLMRNPRAGKSNPLAPLNREIAILKKMDHPSIVKLIEVIEDVQIDNVYMVFELMKEGVVLEVPTENTIDEDTSRSYFRDLVLGIEYLHYSKIIHRDIKPSNLLLSEKNHIKIADFGVSDMFEGDNDLLNKYAGSPAFQAPEVLDHESRDKYSGKAVDVWAMGVTLFCFLYGKCPFYSSNLGELVNIIKNDALSFPEAPFVNPQAQDLISRMLSKQPKGRITVLEIKEHPWLTQGGSAPLPLTEDHCNVIEVTEDEVKNSIKIISKLSSLILAKKVLKGKSFVIKNKNSDVASLASVD